MFCISSLCCDCITLHLRTPHSTTQQSTWTPHCTTHPIICLPHSALPPGGRFSRPLVLCGTLPWRACEGEVQRWFLHPRPVSLRHQTFLHYAQHCESSVLQQVPKHCTRRDILQDVVAEYSNSGISISDIFVCANAILLLWIIVTTFRHDRNSMRTVDINYLKLFSVNSLSTPPLIPHYSPTCSSSFFFFFSFSLIRYEVMICLFAVKKYAQALRDVTNRYVRPCWQLQPVNHHATACSVIFIFKSFFRCFFALYNVSTWDLIEHYTSFYLKCSLWLAV